MINFDNLPQDNPYALPKAGVYKAYIAEAEMKVPQPLADGTVKQPYLNIKYTLLDNDNKNCGTLYDILSESDSSIVQYKISRFVRACGIPLTGSMELKDLAKVVKGKTIALDVASDKKAPADKPRMQVDLFTREGYYLAEEFATIYALIHPEETPIDEDFAALNEAIGNAAERPFDAADGVAPHTPTATEY